MHTTYHVHPDAKARHQMLTRFLRQADKSTTQNEPPRSTLAPIAVKATKTTGK